MSKGSIASGLFFKNAKFWTIAAPILCQKLSLARLFSLFIQWSWDTVHGFPLLRSALTQGHSKHLIGNWNWNLGPVETS